MLSCEALTVAYGTGEYAPESHRQILAVRPESGREQRGQATVERGIRGRGMPVAFEVAGELRAIVERSHKCDCEIANAPDDRIREVVGIVACKCATPVDERLDAGAAVGRRGRHGAGDVWLCGPLLRQEDGDRSHGSPLPAGLQKSDRASRPGH